MNSIQLKEKITALIFMGLAGCVVITGCSMHRHKDEHFSMDAERAAQKVLVIDLADTSEYQPLLLGKPQTAGMRSGRVYLKPGEDCGQHSTKAHEETLVFLSGRGTSLIGGHQTPFEVGQGKICYIPPDTLHNIKNTGSEPLVYIYCVAPVSAAEEHDLHDEHNHSH
jgi:mannose-6-phosphate isomerase-like protein (cupin superfamily)